MAEEVTLLDHEIALLWVEFHVKLSQDSKSLGEVLEMVFLSLAFDDDIVYVEFHSFADFRQTCDLQVFDKLLLHFLIRTTSFSHSSQ